MDIHFKLTIKQTLELYSLADDPYFKSSVTLYGYSRYFIEGGSSNVVESSTWQQSYGGM